MYKRKERLYVTDFINEPVINYPSYYMLSTSMRKNEMLLDTLTALHTLDFSSYRSPHDFDALWHFINTGCFPIYKERYAIGYFGNRMMYLESSGWRGMSVTSDIYKLENWLI
jgi:hypothetical protein